MTLPMFICPEVAGAENGATLTITGEEAHHAAVVRRIRVGEQVDLTDGKGSLARGCLKEARAQSCEPTNRNVK